jgi:hypothetical protein
VQGDSECVQHHTVANKWPKHTNQAWALALNRGVSVWAGMHLTHTAHTLPQRPADIS